MFPAGFDEYRKAIYTACQRCEPEYGPVGAVGYIYQSVKDSLKDIGISVKENRKTIMAIGRLVFLKEEDYMSVKFSYSSSNLDNMTAEQINKIAGV